MDREVVIYCDESGNDGPNYLNDQEPFYVLAGWIVPSGAEVDAAVEIESVRRRNCPDALELKFKTFKKSEGKLQALIKLFGRLGETGLTPIYLFAEKRFCVAGKIVETFLDPCHNPRVRNAFSWDVRTKKEFANTIYERLPAAALDRFAEAYRDPQAGSLENALCEVVEACRRCVNPEMAELLDGSSRSLDQIAAAEVQGALVWGKAGDTLNLPCLVSFLMMAEHLARRGYFTQGKIVHDEQGPCHESYHQTFLHYRNWPDHWQQLVGQPIPYGAIRSILSFETQRSVDQPLVQAADLLAGAIKHVCICLIRGKTLSPSEKEVIRLILPLLTLDFITLGSPVCSDRMLSHVARSFRAIYPSDTTSSRPGSAAAASSVPLPLLPVAGSPPPKDESPKFPITIPIFGLATADQDQLSVICLGDGSRDSVMRDRTFVPLFTDAGLAEQFLAEEQPTWTQPHRVRQFGARDIPDLIERLEAVLPVSTTIIFHGPNEMKGVLDIEDFLDNMRRIWDRTLRAFLTGAVDVLLQRHQIGNEEVVSFLLSSGEYAAMKKSGGPLFTGGTREEAIAALRSGEGKNGHH